MTGLMIGIIGIAAPVARATTRPAAASPRRRSTVASKPSISSALRVSASRRGTGLTLRSGPYSGAQVGAHHAQQRRGESIRLVSVPLATLNTSSLTSDCSARMFARATSST